MMNSGAIKNRFWIMHMVLPIIVGACIYYLIAPDVIFVKKINMTVGFKLYVSQEFTSLFFIKLLRNYLLDFLWGYSLLCSLFFAMGKNTAEWRKILLLAFGFSTAMEFLQMSPSVKGTFDVVDIIVELVAEICAVLIIDIYIRRKRVYEKEK